MTKLAALLLFSCIAMTGWAQEIAEPTPAQARLDGLDDRVTQLGTVEPYNDELAYLTHIHATAQATVYYRGLFDRLEEASDPSSLPVLVDFLNRDVWSWGRRLPAHDLIWGLRDRASALWLAITWAEGTPEDHALAAMNGLRSDTSVRLAPHVAASHLKTLGESARPSIYAVLHTEDMNYRFDGWTVNAVTQLAALLNEDGLAPTDEDNAAVVAGTNAFAKIVFIAYWVQRDDDRAGPMLAAWFRASLQNENIGYIMHGLSYASAAGALGEHSRTQIAEAVSEFADRLLSSVEKRPIQAQDIHLFYEVNHAMASLGDLEVTRQYFTSYLEWRLRVELTDEELVALAGETVLYADRFAEQALGGE